MLEKPKRLVIYQLHKEGQSLRQISRLLKVSKNTVCKILKEGIDIIPLSDKKLENDLMPIMRSLFYKTHGNVVRIQEILKSDYQQDIPYSTLTRLIRKYELREPIKRSGQYQFDPGIEMQHDTSPHKIILNNKKENLQCAALIFAYSRKLFIQYYKRFTRFEAKIFLKEALLFFDGSCRQCVIDNTSVILAAGSGADAIMATEMQEFARMFGFIFKAHAIGHADRKAYVERSFYYVEKNFLVGRKFSTIKDLNQQAIEWCNTVANQKEKRSLGMSPAMAFIQEKSFLLPVPKVLPPIYEYCQRIVDMQGYINFETQRYSVPEKLINKTVDVYKYQDEIQIYYNHQEVAIHSRITEGSYQRITLKGHHTKLWRTQQKTVANQIEKQLLGDNAILNEYVAGLKKHVRGGGLKSLTKLLDFKRTYPEEAFIKGITQALQYNLYDLFRLEALIIKYVAGSYFNLYTEEK